MTGHPQQPEPLSLCMKGISEEAGAMEGRRLRVKEAPSVGGSQESPHGRVRPEKSLRPGGSQGEGGSRGPGLPAVGRVTRTRGCREDRTSSHRGTELRFQGWGTLGGG